MISDLQSLRALYPAAGERALRKQLAALDRHCIAFIALSPFLVLSTADAQGRQDASPRGGVPGFVRVDAAQRLRIPDAPGNHRLDSLSNIVHTGRIGLLFLVPGVDETLRVNGVACLSTDPADLARCTDERRTPKLAIRVTVRSAYLHCAKALMRSDLWNPARHLDRSQLPSMGEMMRDQLAQYRGETTVAETQAEMLVRYRSTL